MKETVLPARAQTLVADVPDVTAVTREGDVLSQWFASGGSSAKPSLIEVQAAIDETESRLAAAQAELERARFALASHEAELTDAQQRAEAALARLNESDAEHAALAEELAALSQTTRSARAEAERLEASIAAAQATREQNRQALAALESRLELASAQTGVVEADPTERDRLGGEKNDLTEAIRESLRRPILTAERNLEDWPAFRNSLIVDHEGIADAIIERRPAEAVARVEEHIRRSYTILPMGRPLSDVASRRDD